MQATLTLHGKNLTHVEWSQLEGWLVESIIFMCMRLCLKAQHESSRHTVENFTEFFCQTHWSCHVSFYTALTHLQSRHKLSKANCESIHEQTCIYPPRFRQSVKKQCMQPCIHTHSSSTSLLHRTIFYWLILRPWPVTGDAEFLNSQNEWK